MAADMPHQVRVLTWNVWWRFGPDWRARQRALLTRLREADADIVALQECWGTAQTSQAHEWAHALGMHAAFAEPGLPPPPDPPESPDQAGVQVGIGLLSRWPVAECRPAAMPSRHRTPPPVALSAVVQHPAGPLHMTVACLEWEPAYNDDRMAQARALAGLGTAPSADGPLPVIVCGDLNAAPASPVLRPLLDVLADAWALGGGDPNAVTLPSDHPHAPLAASELIDQRIDHVLIRPGQPGMTIGVDHLALLGDPVDGIHPSDHRAIVCDLTWTGRPASAVRQPRPGQCARL